MPDSLRVLIACMTAILGKRALPQDDQLVLVVGQRRIQELAGEQQAGVGEYDEGDAELAALDFVHRQAVGLVVGTRQKSSCRFPFLAALREAVCEGSRQAAFWSGKSQIQTLGRT